jgi:hypothetical protein
VTSKSHAFQSFHLCCGSGSEYGSGSVGSVCFWPPGSGSITVVKYTDPALDPSIIYVLLLKIQEVQFKNPNHFEMHYLPHFTSLGYSAAMKSRTGDKEDGCVIFYKGMNTLVLCINVTFLTVFLTGVPVQLSVVVWKTVKSLFFISLFSELFI